MTLFQERFGIANPHRQPRQREVPRSPVSDGRQQMARISFLAASQHRARRLFICNQREACPWMRRQRKARALRLRSRPAYARVLWREAGMAERLGRHGGAGTAPGCPGFYGRAGGVGPGRHWAGFGRDLSALEYRAHGSVSVPVRRNAGRPFHERVRWLPAVAPGWDIGPGWLRPRVSIEFWPTAYRFKRGHRIRVIVAGGAHPRYSRNPGSGEPLGDATTMVVAHQRILHGPGIHPRSR